MFNIRCNKMILVSIDGKLKNGNAATRIIWNLANITNQYAFFSRPCFSHLSFCLKKTISTDLKRKNLVEQWE